MKAYNDQENSSSEFQDDYEKVKNLVQIADYIAEETGFTLKKVGAVTLNLSECPSCHGHECFRINTKDRYCKCFQCKLRGDIYSFLQAYRGLGSRYEALKILAGKINYELKTSKEWESHLRIQEIKCQAAEYYHCNLADRLNDHRIQYLGSAKGEILECTVLKYQTEVRKHPVEVLKKFKIGYSDGGLSKHLTERGFKKSDIQKSGLVNSAGKDWFQGTYIYPHFVNGEVSHFTQKDSLKRANKKYQMNKNHWNRSWFAYNQDGLHFYDEVILVEGENDVLSIAGKARRENVIALMGSISDEQFEVLKQKLQGKVIYACFDNDEVGEGYEHQVISQFASDQYDLRLIHFDKKYKDIDELLCL